MKFLKSSSMIVAIVLAIVVAFLSYNLMPNKIISWDIFGYYLYLPSFFIYNDISLSDLTPLNESLKIYESTPYLYQIAGMPNGSHMIIYQLGMSLLYLPFFLVGHAIAAFGGYPMDGFSSPYQISVFVGGIIYSVIGIFFLRKILLMFFGEKTTILVMVSIILGTNYLLHTTLYGQNLMTHGPLFMLYTIFIFLTIHWHNHQEFKQIILLALISGLMILARPTELMALIIPIFWGVKNRELFIDKLILLWDKKLQVIIFILIVVALYSPQLLYNKICSGEFITSGYSYAGEDILELGSPNIFDVLFSFRKGWLIYSPIMIFALIGIFVLRKNQQNAFIPILLFFVFNLYLISSWSNWWYAGSFGHRAFIQSLPVLAIPMGSFLNMALKWKTQYKVLIFILLNIFIVLNLFQSWQYKNGILNDERMTAAAYFDIFGKVNPNKINHQYLLFDRSTVDVEKPIDKSKFELTKDTILDYEAGDFDNLVSENGNKIIDVNKDVTYPKGFKIRIKELVKGEYALINFSADIFIQDSLKQKEIFMAIYMEHRGKAQGFKTIDLKDLNLKTNVWNEVTTKYSLPFRKGSKDVLLAYIWNNGGIKFKIDNLRLQVYEPKKVK